MMDNWELTTIRHGTIRHSQFFPFQTLMISLERVHLLVQLGIRNFNWELNLCSWHGLLLLLLLLLLSFLLKFLSLYWELELQTSYTPWRALVGHFGVKLFLGTMPKTFRDHAQKTKVISSGIWDFKTHEDLGWHFWRKKRFWGPFSVMQLLT